MMRRAHDDVKGNAEESGMFAATCTTCGVYQLLWLELITNLTKTAHGHRGRFLCPRCGALSSTDFRLEEAPARPSQKDRVPR